MKTLLVALVAAMTLLSCQKASESSAGGSGGDSVGNGGDGIVLEFRKYGRDAYRLAKQNNLQSVDLQKLGLIVESATIVSTADKLISDGSERDALNYPAENKIVVNRTRWQQIQSEKVKMALALHEFLLLMGANDSSYALSSKILNYDTSVLLEPEQNSAVPGNPSAVNAVDILFVIDDSGSMASAQLKLKHHISALYNTLMAVHYLDFQIGVISTSTETAYQPGKTLPGQLYGAVPIIHRRTPDAIAQLQNNVDLGTNGDSTEAHLDAIALSLQGPTAAANKGFYRPDVPLHVIFISDAEDQSKTTGAHLLHMLQKAQKFEVRFHGFILDDLSQCPGDQQDGGSPLKIFQLIKDTNGISYPMCLLDSARLEHIAKVAIRPITN